MSVTDVASSSIGPENDRFIEENNKEIIIYVFYTLLIMNISEKKIDPLLLEEQNI